MFKVVIGFSNGHAVHYTCDSFKVKRYNSEISDLSWDNIKPQALHISLKDIVYITSEKVEDE